MVNKIAIIDCGTNTFHLLIAQIDEVKIHIIHSEKVAARIGQGGINDKIISPEALQRAAQTITAFKEKIIALRANQVFAFATSAFRNASNGHAVQEHIKKITDIDIKIISGDIEAQYIYYGVNSALDIGNDPALIMDIGGGSVEFIIGSRNNILWKHSFEIGAQRLLYFFYKHDPIHNTEVAQLEEYLSVKLESLLFQIKKHNLSSLIGASGTFDTLGDIYCIKNRITYTIDQSEIPLTLEGYRGIHEELISKNKMQRLQIPGMTTMRADMIVVASSLINWLLKQHTFEKIRVSTFSLKEGVLDQIKKGHFQLLPSL